jgi:hypothetical protein
MRSSAKEVMLSNFLRAQATAKLRFGRIMHWREPISQQCHSGHAFSSSVDSDTLELGRELTAAGAPANDDSSEEP